ncbi:D-2-hydroxyacid dehydrogenase [Telluribacter sp.]|jgi:phosphoglycerate dehydrogenase-like enzyme|uniref:D-2-hydroxyacid dehydrogenase n=1 Tax=Telluribacter sp. TaxID=1978767 RepID=UPI002E13C1A8|nr:D-2-hydroxyacid dehydrogenase [Telluribacter sp.]
MYIYIHTDLDESLRKQLRSALSSGHHLYFRSEKENSDESYDMFSQAEIILGNPPLEWFQSPPVHLKFWQLDSAGFDKYRGLELNARVANMGDWFARPCAETIVGGILALYRGVDVLTLLRQRKEWVGAGLRPYLGTLYRQKAIVLGSGTIGTAVRDILEGFRCRVLTLARTSPSADLHSREEFLSELNDTDLVVNTLPGTVHHFVDREVLMRMRKGSVYANVGRGSTTDEEALIEVLRAGHLSGAVLDVTEIEPLPTDSPLWALPNVVLTQHTGGGQVNEDVGKVELFLHNMEKLRNDHLIDNEVDLRRGY